ncbi:uncharacterized protein LOC118418661 [Branchiostoma floridae]|uniref:Uncharacterized protein LOC118418661 n=1 Tax=Branchiostoma floridae TaxID=7739 RepID=A0A9J7LD17_BRAFL|nr:uncharacterized protein LOC118418661 [Branchiostoma floridae]
MVVIPFERVALHKLGNVERTDCERNLKEAKEMASREIEQVIALRKKLAVVDSEGKLRPSPAFLQDMPGLVAKFEAIMPNDEGRSARNYATIARIVLGLLQIAGMEDEEEPFWQFVTDKIGPQIRGMQQRAGVAGVPATPQTSANWLSLVFQALQTLDRLDVR